jgi:hypothetical protein
MKRFWSFGCWRFLICVISVDRPVLTLAVQKRPQLAASEQAKLNQREIQMLRLNLLCAALILLCTAV